MQKTCSYFVVRSNAGGEYVPLRLLGAITAVRGERPESCCRCCCCCCCYRPVVGSMGIVVVQSQTLSELVSGGRRWLKNECRILGVFFTALQSVELYVLRVKILFKL